jgi:hypothetical protein
MKTDEPLKHKGLSKGLPMKKEAPLKRNGLSKKTSDEKRDIPKTQGAE